MSKLTDFAFVKVAEYVVGTVDMRMRIYNRVAIYLDSGRAFFFLAVIGLVVIIGLQLAAFWEQPVSTAIPALTFHEGQTTVLWLWNNGSSKPRIEWGQEGIIEISGWASDVQVNDGEPVLLWNHYMGANATNDSLHASYDQVDEYHLEEQVTLESKTRIRVKFFVTPYVPIETFRLRLGHYKWYWSEATVADETFIGRSQGSWTRVSLGPNLDKVDINETGQGANFFDAHYEVTNVEGRTLIADEVIEFGKP